MERQPASELENSNPAAPGATPPPPVSSRSCHSSFLTRVKEKLCTWQIVKTLFLGQILSLFICGTAVTSQYLAEKYHVNTPMLQSFINYCLLFLVYTMTLAFKKDNDNLLQILKRKWWKYILLGLVDVEANYSIVKAYQYTTLTSVQLLDCFGIPVLMALSWFILRARYKLIHFIAVAVCLLGVGTMVGADILAGRHDGEGSDVVIGDVLVLLGASLYAISNVSEEYIVKNLSRVEFLGMVGLFGTIISGLQLAILEHKDITSIQWNWKIVLLFLAFALCMFGLYSFMPVVIKVTSATSVNLGILTADLYSLFFGLFLFGYKTSWTELFDGIAKEKRCIHGSCIKLISGRAFKCPATITTDKEREALEVPSQQPTKTEVFSALYLLSFVVIMVGFIMYCSTPTRSAEAVLTSLPLASSIGFDNHALKMEENLNAAIVSPAQHSKEESQMGEAPDAKLTAL